MKEKTKELADSVGAVYPVMFMGRHDGVLFTETELETFVALVAAAEREACAQIVDDFGDDWMCNLHMLSKQIRARRNHD
jgi:hypothetical protein